MTRAECEGSPEPAARSRSGTGRGSPDARGSRGARRVRPILATVGVGLFLWVAGCSEVVGPSVDLEPGPGITELPRELTAGESRAIEASNAFGFDLFRSLAQEEPGNLFLSPLSASMALGMTLNGAAGSTFDSMRSTLRFGDLDEGEINASYEGLLELLTELDPHVELAVGNAVWYREGYVVRDDFRQRVERHFGARVEGLDFADEAAAEVINAWSRETTRGRIEEIVEPPIPAHIVAYLMNAVYFNAGWSEPFDAELTRTEPFHRRDGSTVSVPLMIRDDTLSHFSGEGFDAVDLPYAGGAFSMTIVVPREGETNLDALIEDLDAEWWTRLVESFGTGRAQIWLPRFELEWEGVLNDALDDLGMGIAFRPGADFSRLFEGTSPWIDEVKQKSFVQVDEEGTEAAAVTSVAMTTSLPPQIRADRPFLFAIRERHSGTVLFLGALSDPVQG